MVLAALASPAQAQQATSLHGFSIVLVQGDMVATAKQSELPDAAARAIGDMKGLLPFRSYHLVDSAWVLANSASGLINAKLKGPDQVDYDVVMEALPASGGVQRVAFRLRESGGDNQAQALDRDVETLNRIVTSLRQKYEEAMVAQAIEARSGSGEKGRSSLEFLRSQLAEAERRVAEMRQRLRDDASAQPVEDMQRQVDEQAQRVRQLEERQKGLLEKYSESHPDMRVLNRMIGEARMRLETMHAAARAGGRGAANARPSATAGATLIETMFTMRVGETVVVGTSRTGVDKALVAVLTAAPPPGATKKF